MMILFFYPRCSQAIGISPDVAKATACTLRIKKLIESTTVVHLDSVKSRPSIVPSLGDLKGEVSL